MDEIDPARALLDRLLRERGIKMAHASRQIGKEESYLFQYIKKGKPEKLPEDARIILAQMLDLPDDSALKTGVALSNPPASNVRPTAGVKPSYGQRDVPIRGRAQGGADGAIDLGDGTIDWAYRSPELIGVKDAYALYVDGDSITDFGVPHGSIAYVHPYRRPQPGRLCVLVTRSGTAYIKRLTRITTAKIVLEQSNPPKTLEFSTLEINGLQMVTSVVFP